MKDFKLTISSLGYFIAELTKMITTEPNKAWRITVKGWRESRSLSMNALQHVVYGEISKYLISKGRVDWCENKTKREMKNSFLGWITEEYTDLKTGEVTVKEVLRSTSGLDQGDGCQYTTQVLDFAQTIGCEIKIPSKCDYRELMERQNQ